MINIYLKVMVVFILIFHLNEAKSQDTFSLFIDFDQAIADSPHSIYLEDESFIISATYSGDSSIVSSLTEYNFKGVEVMFKLYNDFLIGIDESLIAARGGYKITGNDWSEDSVLSRGNKLLQLDENFEIIKDTTLFYEPFTATNTFGVQNYNNENLIYFETIDKTAAVESKGYIYVLDAETDTVKQVVVMKGIPRFLYSKFQIRNLEKAPDGNYIISAITDRVSEGQKIELIKISREGEVLERIFDQFQIIRNTLAQDKFGDFYFYTQDTPFLIDGISPFRDSGGGVTKLNSDLDSVIWSRPFNRLDSPTDPNRKRYFSNGIVSLSDGNFITYGNIFDRSIFKELAFLTKFDQEGEILWTRFFKPTTIINGIIRESSFRDCKELPDGRILCLGQSDNPLKEIPFDSEIWLLMLDEEGCLEPGCEMDVIITTTTTTSTSSTLPTQSGRIYPNPVTDILHIEEVSFDSYMISDLVGRQLLRGDFDTEISLPSSLPSGMYILQLQENNRLKSVFKFLKE